eukprot:CAMPEP_0184025306 /NCGR_PEP_ID=MMETSP0954-20121128/12714_1 /TAXON_ID=627963 /ORGANISM="Aplanochytrium sp, Strain PBS07" /LENGTH=1228 /DNA_ID=CAMNT_0026309029 /DNA_START=291 /DNA_END=3980 /DNA_ORIENTATION=-
MSQSSPIHSKLETKAVRYYLKENPELVHEVDFLGRSPLHRAALRGDVDVCRLLIRRKSDIHLRSLKGRTPLHQAARLGNNSAVVSLLLEHGSDAYACDCLGRTPLHYASLSGDTESCRLLIDEGVNINALDEAKASPVHFAAKSGHVNVFKLFLKYFPDYNARTVDGADVYDILYESGCEDLIEDIHNASKRSDSGSAMMHKKKRRAKGNKSSRQSKNTTRVTRDVSTAGKKRSRPCVGFSTTTRQVFFKGESNRLYKAGSRTLDTGIVELKAGIVEKAEITDRERQSTPFIQLYRESVYSDSSTIYRQTRLENFYSFLSDCWYDYAASYDGIDEEYLPDLQPCFHQYCRTYDRLSVFDQLQVLKHFKRAVVEKDLETITFIIELYENELKNTLEYCIDFEGPDVPYRLSNRLKLRRMCLDYYSDLLGTGDDFQPGLSQVDAIEIRTMLTDRDAIKAVKYGVEYFDTEEELESMKHHLMNYEYIREAVLKFFEATNQLDFFFSALTRSLNKSYEYLFGWAIVYSLTNNLKDGDRFFVERLDELFRRKKSELKRWLTGKRISKRNKSLVMLQEYRNGIQFADEYFVSRVCRADCSDNCKEHPGSLLLLLVKLGLVKMTRFALLNGLSANVITCSGNTRYLDWESEPHLEVTWDSVKTDETEDIDQADAPVVSNEDESDEDPKQWLVAKYEPLTPLSLAIQYASHSNGRHSEIVSLLLEPRFNTNVRMGEDAAVKACMHILSSYSRSIKGGKNIRIGVEPFITSVLTQIRVQGYGGLDVGSSTAYSRASLYQMASERKKGSLEKILNPLKQSESTRFQVQVMDMFISRFTKVLSRYADGLSGLVTLLEQSGIYLDQKRWKSVYEIFCAALRTGNPSDRESVQTFLENEQVQNFLSLNVDKVWRRKTISSNYAKIESKNSSTLLPNYIMPRRAALAFAGRRKKKEKETLVNFEQLCVLAAENGFSDSVCFLYDNFRPKFNLELQERILLVAIKNMNQKLFLKFANMNEGLLDLMMDEIGIEQTCTMVLKHFRVNEYLERSIKRRLDSLLWRSDEMKRNRKLRMDMRKGVEFLLNTEKSWVDGYIQDLIGQTESEGSKLWFVGLHQILLVHQKYEKLEDLISNMFIQNYIQGYNKWTNEALAGEKKYYEDFESTLEIIFEQHSQLTSVNALETQFNEVKCDKINFDVEEQKRIARILSQASPLEQVITTEDGRVLTINMELLTDEKNCSEML